MSRREMWQRFERIFNKADDDTDDATFAAALHFLMHTPHGVGVLRRVFPTGASSTADIEHLARLIAREWRAYAGANVSADAESDSLQPGEADTHKGTAPMDSPVVTICKSFVEAGQSFMSETELTKLIEEYALRDRRDGETEAQCFSRVFSGSTTEAVLFRKAIAICKSADVRPRGSDDDDAAKAYAKLTRLAERERARHPGLTPEQAFAKCFADPANKALAELAHQRPIAVW